MKTYSARSVAAAIVQQVLEGRSLSDVLQKQLSILTSNQDRAFVQAISYGVCRLYPRLDVLLSLLLKKPLRERDIDIYALLLIGLYQLLEMRVSTHAAVSETVDVAKSLKKPWAIALVNAVLRNFLRQKDNLITKVMRDPEAYYAHPQWLIDKIKQDWPENFDQILLANNEQPPMIIRVNPRIITRDAYLTKLKDQGIKAVALDHTRQGIMLAQASAVEALPGFEAGEFSVQDGAAQLCAPLLLLQPGERVLDAAAAPGGKLTHMLEVEPQLQAMVAVEKDAQRLALVRENLQRLGLQATCIAADASLPETWWDGERFEKVLLDAPCSASGVIRRHPDIKILRRAADLKALVVLQNTLLDKLWPLLKPGGILLYATCSIFNEENDGIIQNFLSAHQDAELMPIEAEWGIATKTGRQILPGMHAMDGFFYARLKRHST